jgi:hypothetical protein
MFQLLVDLSTALLMAFQEQTLWDEELDCTVMTCWRLDLSRGSDTRTLLAKRDKRSYNGWETLEITGKAL